MQYAKINAQQIDYSIHASNYGVFTTLSSGCMFVPLSWCCCCCFCSLLSHFLCYLETNFSIDYRIYFGLIHGQMRVFVCCGCARKLTIFPHLCIEKYAEKRVVARRCSLHIYIYILSYNIVYLTLEWKSSVIGCALRKWYWNASSRTILCLVFGVQRKTHTCTWETKALSQLVKCIVTVTMSE